MISARPLRSRDDGQKLKAFLDSQMPNSYDMSVSLRLGGWAFEGLPGQAEFFGAFNSGRIIGALAHTQKGQLEVYSPDPEASSLLIKAWRKNRAFLPRKTTGVFGPARHVNSLSLIASAQNAHLVKKSRSMGLYTLIDITKGEALTADTVGLSTRRAKPSDLEMLGRWLYNFDVEEENVSPSPAAFQKAKDEALNRARRGELYLLEDRGTPVSFCGVKRFLPNWLYVCPVWTAPEARGNGYAGRNVLGALKLANEQMCKRTPERTKPCDAILFASSDSARRAYQKAGFEPVAEYQEYVFTMPVYANAPLPSEPRPAVKAALGAHI